MFTVGGTAHTSGPDAGQATCASDEGISSRSTEKNMAVVQFDAKIASYVILEIERNNIKIVEQFDIYLIWTNRRFRRDSRNTPTSD